ncbi:MAG TPA: alpha/beta hydrolase [Mycobacterium sp.]|nr:alpha/beta hydrolase [Mycobacterium sp.]
MVVDLRGARAVLLPGTGSDDDFVRRAFSDALRDAGASVIAVTPQPSALVDGYVAALDNAAAEGPVVVGGVSIGAAVAVTWALAHPRSTAAVLAALPAWTGSPDGAVAAISARASAAMLRRDGLAAATAAMQASSPGWLAVELARSWAAQWPGLPQAMEEAAGFTAPTREQLHQLAVPMGVAAAVDDPVHPLDVAIEWSTAAPRAAMRTVTLDEIGANPGALGAACMAGLQTL